MTTETSGKATELTPKVLSEAEVKAWLRAKLEEDARLKTLRDAAERRQLLQDAGWPPGYDPFKEGIM